MMSAKEQSQKNLRLALHVQNACRDDDSLDVGGIVWFEHINLVCGEKKLTELFYINLLGCKPPESKSFHVNLGQQQFHLNSDTGMRPQRISGSIGVAVPSLDEVRARAKIHGEQLSKKSLYSLTDHEHSLTIICPWGNVFSVFPSRAESTAVQPHSKTKLPRLALAHYSYDDSMAIRGEPGIRYVEFKIGVGLAVAVCEFYRYYFGAFSKIVQDEETKRALVCVGPSTHFIFSETDDGNIDEIVRAQSGIHICIYISHFKDSYKKLEQNGLIWTNPRFTYLDTCNTYDEAKLCRQFRFKNIRYNVTSGDETSIDLKYELEHETRAIRHHQFLKVQVDTT